MTVCKFCGHTNGKKNKRCKGCGRTINQKIRKNNFVPATVKPVQQKPVKVGQGWVCQSYTPIF